MPENSGWHDEKRTCKIDVEHSFHTKGKGVEKLTFFLVVLRENERKGKVVALGQRMPRHGMTKKGQISLKLGRGEKRGSSQPVKQMNRIPAAATQASMKHIKSNSKVKML